MKTDALMKELARMIPDQFEDTDRKELDELKKIGLPKDFCEIYQSKTPIDCIKIGKFNLLRIHDLINENIWDSPGEDLLEKGFPIIGTDSEGFFYCMHIGEKNKLGNHDILLADPEEDYSAISAKDIRRKLKYINGSFEDFLGKEMQFLRKAAKKKAV